MNAVQAKVLGHRLRILSGIDGVKFALNDVSGGLDDPALLEVAASHGATLVVGHLRGTPESMQRRPQYDDVLREVASELAASVELAERAGVARSAIVVDPGIGFGKRLEDNLSLIAGVAWLREQLGLPVMLGPSRKAFLGTLTGDPVTQRDGATLDVYVCNYTSDNTSKAEAVYKTLVDALKPGDVLVERVQRGRDLPLKRRVANA